MYYRAEPVGSTATILLKMYKEKGVAVPPHIAGLMLSAIISDTLLLKSPTCTPEDAAAAHELASVAGVELQTYGLEMLRAGATLGEMSIAQLVSTDCKEFSMSGAKVEIAQVNAIDFDEVFSRQAELESALQDIISSKRLDLFLFVVNRHPPQRFDRRGTRSTSLSCRIGVRSHPRRQPRTPEGSRLAQAADRPGADRHLQQGLNS